MANVSEFWNGQKHICLSDPNILACKDSPELLQQLVDTGAKIDFNQGLDARLLTPEKAELLARMNLVRPHFAMDTMESMEAVKRGLRYYVDAYKRVHGKWNWRNANVFCLTNFDTTHEQDIERMETIRDCECHPYIMIYNKPSAPRITRRLQRYCNCMVFYAKYPTFNEFLVHEYKS